MMRRRAVLGSIALASTAGCVDKLQLMFSRREHDEDAEVLKTEQSARNEMFKKISFYADGFVDVFFPKDHSAGGFYVSHRASEQEYASWDAPEFSGPVTVDLQTVIRQTDPVPSRKFKWVYKSKPGEDTVWIVSPAKTTVPPEFFREEDLKGDGDPTPTPSPTDGDSVEL